MSRLLLNHVSPLPAGSPTEAPRNAVRDFHRRLPEYAPTVLVDLPEVAASCGVGRLLAKAEVERMGLPSFKVLGASWATYRLLCERLRAAGAVGNAASSDDAAGGGAAEPDWSTIGELADLIGTHLGPLRLVAATDGNHGRAVARMAKLCRLAATILVPEGTVEARIGAIAGEGAEVLVVAGTYDDAVRASAAFADGDDTVREDAVAVVDGSGGAVGAEARLVVSDTSWPGYEDVPGWVIEGYSTIFAELDEQLPALGVTSPDVVVVPLGVGALGAAAATSLRAGLAADAGPLLVGVEPESAACVAAAVEAGELVEVPGPHRSIMAGLNCGLASPIALPLVSASFVAFVTVDDDRCRAAIRTLAANGLDVGETGAAALAGLTALVDEHRSTLPLPDDAVVVLLATEGVTDPTNFEEIVGRQSYQEYD